MIARMYGEEFHIVLNQDDAEFVLLELTSSAPGDGFTRDLRELIDFCWPDEVDSDGA